jgi:lipopolysaccharide transport system permease protein
MLRTETMVIRPSNGWSFPDFREIWKYRELLYFFVWRDIKIRYKQTVLGALWAVIQPFFTMVVFSIFFGKLAGVPSEGIPYPIFVYCALVPWNYFASALTKSSNSMVVYRNIITKVYFPRVIIPIASVLSGLLDFTIAFSVLIAMMLFYKIVPTISVLFVPILILLVMATAIGVGLWLSALNVIYRDVRYAIPFGLQFWMFATPIVYSRSLVPEAWGHLYGINPMVSVIEGFRWALLGRGSLLGSTVMISAFTILLILITGFFYFQRMERIFVDVV